MPDLTESHTLTDEERAVYEGPDLASTLLVRLGMIEPSQVEKQTRKKRRRLRTPKDVIRAISDVAAELEEGEIQPQIARTRLYALQTLLVAMRMHAESEPQPALPSRPLQLEGVASTTTPEPSHEDALLSRLQHLIEVGLECPKENSHEA
jgi:hypothetical protein